MLGCVPRQQQYFTFPPAHVKSPISPHLHQHFLLSIFFFFTITVLVSIVWYLIVVLIWISLITNEHLFMCSLSICISPWEKCLLKSLVCVLVAQSCPTLCDPGTVAYQAPLSMGFPRQEYWSGLLFPSPGDLPYPGIEPGSPALQADSLPSEPPGKPLKSFAIFKLNIHLFIIDP